MNNLPPIIAEIDKKEQGFLSICRNLILGAGPWGGSRGDTAWQNVVRGNNFLQRAFHFIEFLLYLQVLFGASPAPGTLAGVISLTVKARGS